MPVTLMTIVCDDIRREEGNKFSYMGIYQQGMNVPAFPTQLAKICFVSMLRVPVEEEISTIVYRVFKDEEVLFEATMSEAELAAARTAALAAAPSEPDLHQTFVGMFQVSPLHLESECILKFRAVVNGGEVKGGTMKILRSLTSK